MAGITQKSRNALFSLRSLKAGNILTKLDQKEENSTLKIK